MEFVHRAPGSPSRLGILPGSFNPITVAHVGLAMAAERHCDEILFVLPRVFPHKSYAGASLEERLDLVQAAVGDDDRFSLGISDAGLFVEIANECRVAYAPGVRLSFLCGRDAAERIAGWDYGKSGAFAEMLGGFDLLVARRRGEYSPPPDLSDGMERLDIPEELDAISATEVRLRIAAGGNWEHLVPAAIRERVRKIYSRSGATALG